MAWDIEELKKIRYEHYQVKNTSDNDEMVEDADTYIFNLDYMIGLMHYYNDFNDEDYEIIKASAPSYRSIVKNDTMLLRDFVDYTPFIDMLARYRKKLILPKLTLPRQKTDAVEILDTTDEFYSQFPSKIYSAYRSLADTYDTRLQFFDWTDEFDTVGVTYFYPYTNDIFIEIGCDDNLEEYSTMNHEAGHGIASILNPFISIDPEKHGFSEVESIFMELIGDDFVGQKLGKQKEMLMKAIDDLRTYINFAHKFSTKKKMYDTLSKKEYRKKSIAQKYIQSMTGAKIANEVLYTELADNIPYVISYLTAIELYLMYQDAPDEAINMYYDIIMCSDMDVDEYMVYVQSMGIIPGAHFNKYIDLLFKRNGELSDKRLIKHA